MLWGRKPLMRRTFDLATKSRMSSAPWASGTPHFTRCHGTITTRRRERPIIIRSPSTVSVIFLIIISSSSTSQPCLQAILFCYSSSSTSTTLSYSRALRNSLQTITRSSSNNIAAIHQETDEPLAIRATVGCSYGLSHFAFNGGRWCFFMH